MDKTKKLSQDLIKIQKSELSFKRYNIFIVLSLIVLLLFGGLVYYVESVSIRVLVGVGIVSVITALFYFISKKSKLKKGYDLLEEAIDNLRRNNYKKTFEEIFDAYELTKETKLLFFMFNFIDVYRPDIDKQSRIFTLELDNLKNSQKTDNKLIEILRQILDAIENINRNKRYIERSQQKIIELKQEITLTEEPELLEEFKNIILRYNQIIDNGNKKIKFYEDRISKLLNIKHKIVISQKILKAKEELKHMEEELWTDSFSDETQISEPQFNRTFPTTSVFNTSKVFREHQEKDISNLNDK